MSKGGWKEKEIIRVWETRENNIYGRLGADQDHGGRAIIMRLKKRKKGTKAL